MVVHYKQLYGITASLGYIIVSPPLFFGTIIMDNATKIIKKAISNLPNNAIVDAFKNVWQGLKSESRFVCEKIFVNVSFCKENIHIQMLVNKAKIPRF